MRFLLQSTDNAADNQSWCPTSCELATSNLNWSWNVLTRSFQRSLLRRGAFSWTLGDPHDFLGPGKRMSLSQTLLATKNNISSTFLMSLMKLLAVLCGEPSRRNQWQNPLPVQRTPALSERIPLASRYEGPRQRVVWTWGTIQVCKS
jgi:hypothetical protein